MSGSLQGDPRQRRDLHPVRDRHQHPARGLRCRDCLRRSDQRLDSQRAARAGHAGRRHETQPGRRRLQGGRQPELRRRLGGDLLGQPLHHAGRQGRRVRPRGVVRRRAGAGDGRRHGRRRGYSDRRHRRQRLPQQEHGGQPQRFVRQGRRDGQRLHGLPRKPRRPLRLPPALRHAGGQRAGRAARASRSRSAARSSRARRIPSATRSAAWSAKTWSKALPERRFPSSSVGFRN